MKPQQMSNQIGASPPTKPTLRSFYVIPTAEGVMLRSAENTALIRADAENSERIKKVVALCDGTHSITEIVAMMPDCRPNDILATLNQLHLHGLMTSPKTPATDVSFANSFPPMTQGLSHSLTPILVLVTGRIAGVLQARFAALPYRNIIWQAIEPDIQRAELAELIEGRSRIVAINDGPAFALLQELSMLARTAGASLLAAWHYGDRMRALRFRAADDAPCFHCFLMRRQSAEQHQPEWRQFVAAVTMAGRSGLVSFPLTPQEVAFGAGVMQMEIEAWINSAEPETGSRFADYHLYSGQHSEHPLLRVPTCAQCGRSEEAPYARRTLPLLDLPQTPPRRAKLRLASDLLTGIMTQQVAGRFVEAGVPLHKVAIASAKIAVLTDSDDDEFVARGASVDSEAIALKRAREALLKHYSARLYQSAELHKASYHDVEWDAIDPRRLINYTPAQRRGSDYPFAAFDPDETMEWVWGYSLTDERPQLVPAQHALYQLQARPQLDAATQAGLGIGTTLNQAIVDGLKSTITFDAATIGWRRQMALPRIDPRHLPDLNSLFDSISAEGLELNLHWATLDQPLPTVVSWLYDTQNMEQTAAATAAVASGPSTLAAAKLSIERTLETRRSIRQWLRNGPLQPDTAIERERALFFALPGVQPGYAHLQTAMLLSKLPAITPHDQPQSLDDWRRHLRQQGFELFVIDLTPSDIQALGYHVVRTLVIGMLPPDMTDTPHLGNERLYRSIDMPPVEQPGTFSTLPSPYVPRF